MKASTMRLVKAADIIPLVSEGDSITHVTTRLGGHLDDICTKLRREKRSGQMVVHWNEGGVMGVEFLTIAYQRVDLVDD